MMIQAQLTAQQVESIQAIVDYNWSDEADDFKHWLLDEGLDETEEMEAAEGPHHVFVHLTRVQEFLDSLQVA